MIIHIFYNSLFYSIRMTLDAASRGALMNSPQDVAYNLIEEMSKNHHSWGSVWQVTTKSTPKTNGLYEFNVFDHMNAKVDAFYQKINSLSIAPYTPYYSSPYLCWPHYSLLWDMWS